MKTKLFYKIFAFTFGMMLLITVLAHVLIFMIAPSENVLITSTTVTNEDVLAFSEVDMPQLITQTILKSFPLSFACCMVISLVFSFLFSKGITGPILSISTSVHQMSKLDRTAEITVISTDEIGGLANDINSLSIQNECVPLSPDELQHIFEPFYRPNRARNPANGGNGLGLYIVKTILDKQGLQYCFTSMKSKTGMEFVIYF